MLFLSFYFDVCVATTPRGTPTPEKITDIPMNNFYGSIQEIIGKVLDQQVSPQIKPLNVAGNNHLGVWLVPTSQGTFLCMERRYEDYGDKPPFHPCDKEVQACLIQDRYQMALKVMAENRLVPLMERVIKDEKGKKSYVEFYPFVDGQDGASAIKACVNDPSQDDLLQDLLTQMGKQIAKMMEVEPHADCQPANFLVTTNREVVAIDFRGALREYGKDRHGTKTCPVELFLLHLAGIIKQKLSETTEDPKFPLQTYQTILTLCCEAFKMGVYTVFSKPEIRSLYDIPDERLDILIQALVQNTNLAWDNSEEDS